MAKRFGAVRQLVQRQLEPSLGDRMIGHPCGAIAPVSWLREHPEMSTKVSDYLLNDSSFSGDFESMLLTMVSYGCPISRACWRHLKHWRARGCPHWTNNSALSASLIWWWDKYAWLIKVSFDPRSEHYDAGLYYRDIAAYMIEKLERAARGEVTIETTPV